jgi:uncharacterized protein (TIGR02118 family)
VFREERLGLLMIKTMALLSRRPGVAPEQFDAHWHHPHGDPLSLAIDTLRHYVQSTRKDVEPVSSAATYDGIAEVWLDDVETAAGLTEHPKFAAAQADQINFMQPDAVRYLMTEERAVTGEIGPGDGAGYKVMHLVRRPDGGSPEDFHAEWADPRDAELGAALGAVRHVRCHSIDVTYAGDEEPTYDGVRELWFDDLAALQRAHADQAESWRALFGPAVADTSRSTLLVCTQRRLR